MYKEFQQGEEGAFGLQGCLPEMSKQASNSENTRAKTKRGAQSTIQTEYTTAAVAGPF